MSFIRFWIGATIIGIGITVAILMWAMRLRQFKEPDRAAYLPLAGMNEAPPRTRPSRDAMVLVGVLGLGVTAMILTIVVAMTAP